MPQLNEYPSKELFELLKIIQQEGLHMIDLQILTIWRERIREALFDAKFEEQKLPHERKGRNKKPQIIWKITGGF